MKILLVAAGLVLATMSGARADDDDHDFAKRALEQGRALPLADRERERERGKPTAE